MRDVAHIHGKDDSSLLSKTLILLVLLCLSCYKKSIQYNWGDYLLFNSYIFIFLFLPVVLMVYFLLNWVGRERISKTFLVLASLYFYAYFNYSYFFIIMFSIIFNYSTVHIMAKKKKLKKLIFIIGLFFNISILVYFKYYDFFISNINLLFRTDFSLLNVLLPLGISFFTFQQVSFMVDSYKDPRKKYDFLSYCLFVTFFPQLIAGPIVLPDEMLPQFQNNNNKHINFENLNKGFYMFTIGLAKKVLIADSIAPLANSGFDRMTSLTFMESWITSLSYTMQLYFDFSGYCDMAMGIAFMFNITLPKNFNSPYKSKDIQEFWKNWHMTLGRFFTNYLYIPLGGNRKSKLKTLRNLMIVFITSGVWHGAGWNYIIWGFLHGLSILIHRVWRDTGRKLNSFISWLITFNLINILWIFFRSKNIENALKVIRSMLDFSTINKLVRAEYFTKANLYFEKGTTLSILFLAIYFTLVYRKNSYSKIVNLKYKSISIIENSLYFIMSVLLLNRISEFLYFNF